MGKDRQEKKLKNSKKVESDRDEALHYPGSARYEQKGEKGKPIDE